MKSNLQESRGQSYEIDKKNLSCLEFIDGIVFQSGSKGDYNLI